MLAKVFHLKNSVKVSLYHSVLTAHLFYMVFITFVQSSDVQCQINKRAQSPSKILKNVTERMLFPNTDAAKEDVDDEAGKAEPRPSQDQL